MQQRCILWPFIGINNYLEKFNDYNMFQNLMYLLFKNLLFKQLVYICSAQYRRFTHLYYVHLFHHFSRCLS